MWYLSRCQKETTLQKPSISGELKGQKTLFSVFEENPKKPVSDLAKINLLGGGCFDG